MYRKTFNDFGYPEDVKRIVLVAAKNGYFLSPNEACDLWDKYSDTMCASWMHVSEDDGDVWGILQCYIEGDGYR